MRGSSTVFGLLLVLAWPPAYSQVAKPLRAAVEHWMRKTGQIVPADEGTGSKVEQVLPAPGDPELLAVEESFPIGQSRLHLALVRDGVFSKIRIPGEQVFPGSVDHLEWFVIAGLPAPVLGAWESTTHGNGDLFLYEVHPESAKLLLKAAAVDSYMEASEPKPGTWKAKRGIWSSTYKGDRLRLQTHAVELGPAELELSGVEQFFDAQEKLVASSPVSHRFIWDEGKHGYFQARPARHASK